MSCVILGCRSHSSRNENNTENISFHRFPTEVTMKEKWIKAVSRKNWEWKKHHRVCSKHFNKDCFINFNHKWPRLKSNAIPSLNLLSELDVFASTSDTPLQSIQMPLGQQHIKVLTRQVSLLRKYIERLEKVARRRLFKINSLQQKTQRLKKQNIKLYTRIFNLQKNEKIERENLLESLENITKIIIKNDGSHEMNENECI
ncbi:hypothetical protein ACJJTC_003895 [Scirpophaga incertulas]